MHFWHMIYDKNQITICFLFVGSCLFFESIFFDSISMWQWFVDELRFSPRDIKSCVRLVNRVEFCFQLEIVWFYFFTLCTTNMLPGRHTGVTCSSLRKKKVLPRRRKKKQPTVCLKLNRYPCFHLVFGVYINIHFFFTAEFVLCILL